MTSGDLSLIWLSFSSGFRQSREGFTSRVPATGSGLKFAALAGVILPYPACSEVGKPGAATYLNRGLTSPLARRIIVVLRRFG
jgi:hypothetical protein